MADLIALGDKRQQFYIDSLLLQGHVLLRQVVPKAQVLLAFLEHDLEWLVRKALLGHALNASYQVASISSINELLDSFGEDIQAFSTSWQRHSLINKSELEVKVELIIDAKARDPTR